MVIDRVVFTKLLNLIVEAGIEVDKSIDISNNICDLFTEMQVITPEVQVIPKTVPKVAPVQRQNMGGIRDESGAIVNIA